MLLWECQALESARYCHLWPQIWSFPLTEVWVDDGEILLLYIRACALLQRTPWEMHFRLKMHRLTKIPLTAEGHMCYIRYFEARNDFGKSNFLVFKSFGMKIGDSCKYPFCPNSHKRNLLQILAFISNGILNCKINSTNRGTFSNSVRKIILMVSMVQGV